MGDQLSNWNPYKTHVQGGLREGNFINGQFILLCAGPPFYNMLAGGADALTSNANTMVYPIGLTQNISISQNKAFSRIFEIGSDRSYYISGRSVGQLNLGRPLYHGPSLLRAMYAYYDTSEDAEGEKIIPLITGSTALINRVTPFSIDGPTLNGSVAKISDSLHSVKIPPGHDNLFINLASDLFSQPVGLLLILMDNAENYYATMYLEQCVVPSHNFAVDSQGLLVQESCSVQFERIIPIHLAQLGLLSGILTDETNSYEGL